MFLNLVLLLFMLCGLLEGSRLGVPPRDFFLESEWEGDAQHPKQLGRRTQANELERIGNNGGANFPLPKCKGDCDSDSECQGTLKCFQRRTGDPGPYGCVGTTEASTDYCFDASDIPSGFLARVANDGDPSSLYPLERCLGDCDSDEDCMGSLECFQRRSSDPGPPNCSGNTDGSTDYCYDRNDDDDDDDDTTVPPPGTLGRVANDGEPSSLYPLARCLGDCDRDNDCSGSLECYQRSSNDRGPPNCSGNTEASTDYCYNPADDEQDDDGGSGSCSGNSFVLRMYWEEGYFWQESRSERFWCMECEGSSCSSGDDMEIHTCDRNSECLEFRNLIRLNGSEYAQIKIADRNLCFEIVGQNRMELRECVDTDYPRQQFVAMNGSFSGGGRFEIGTVFRPGGCLTQQHHPRRGERIKREDCGVPRGDDTSFWVRY